MLIKYNCEIDPDCKLWFSLSFCRYRACPRCDLQRVESCMAQTARPLPALEFSGHGIVQMESAYQCLQDDACCRPDNISGQGSQNQAQDNGNNAGLPCVGDLGDCVNHRDCCSQICASSGDNGDTKGKCAPSRKNLLRERLFDPDARKNRGNR